MQIPRSLRWGLLSVISSLAFLASVGCGGTSKSQTVPVVAPPAPPPTQPVLSGPAKVTAGAAGLTVSVPVQAGCTYTWAISGGTLTAGQGTPQVTFTAGAVSPISLSCVAVDAGGRSSAAGVLSIAVVAAPVVPAVNAPGQVTAGAAGLVAWIPIQPDCTYAWTLSNGTITSGAATNTILFTAGTHGSLVVSCVVTNSVGTASAPGRATVTVIDAPTGIGITTTPFANQNSTGLVASVPDQAGYSYVWTLNGGTITAGQGSAAIVYSVGSGTSAALACVVTNPAGTASDPIQATVTVVPLPTAPITASPYATSLLPGATASVPAQPFSTYAWSISGGTITGGAGSNSITYTPRGLGTLTLSCLVTSATGMVSQPGTAVVTVVSAPVLPVLTAPVTVTAGNTGYTATTMPQEGMTFAWSLSSGVISSGQNTFAISFKAGLSGPITLSCTVTNLAGTAVTASKFIDVILLPGTSPIQAPAFVTANKSGYSATIPAQPNVTYTWTLTGATLSSGQGTSSITFTAGAPGPGSLYCTVANALGDKATSTASIIVVDPPDTTISAASGVLMNSTGVPASVPVQNMSSFVWTVSGATLVTGQGGGQGTHAITFDVGAPGTVTLGCTVTNAAGDVATGTKLVAVVPTPDTPIVTVPAYVTAGLPGSSASIPPQAGVTYVWTLSSGSITAGQGTEAVTFTAGAAGPATITCAVTNAASITRSGSAPFMSVPPPATPVITTAATVVAATTGNPASVVAQANSTYAWTITGGTVATGQGTTAITYTAGAGPTLTLSCVVTNQAGTPSTPGTISVSVPNWVAPVVYLNSTLTAGMTGRIASTQDQGPSGTYTWTVTNGAITGGQGTRVVTFTVGAVGTLTAQVVVQNGSGGPTSASASANIVAPAATPDPLAPPSAHPGDSWMKASITPQAGMTYFWSQSGAPAGSILSGQGSTMIGFSAGATAGTLALQADVNNGADDFTTTRNINVQNGIWVIKDGGLPALPGTGLSATVLQNGRVLVAGGSNGGSTYFSTAMIYDPPTRQWFKVGNMTTGRVNHTATLLADGRVLVVGGGAGSTRIATAEIFNPATNTWTATTGPLAFARFSHAAALLYNGKVLVSGGNCAVATNNSTVEIFDPATGTFSAGASMTLPRYYHALTDLSGGSTTSSTLLVVGGSGGTTTYLATSAQYTAEVGVYNGTTLTWTPVTALTKGVRQQHTATLLNNGTVLLAGSNAVTIPAGGVNGQITCELFTFNAATPATSTFAPGAVLWQFPKDASSAPFYVQGRYNHTATKLGDGRVLLAGGQVANASWTSEFIDATGATASPTAPTAPTPQKQMLNGRSAHGAALLTTGPDAGKVLAVGGTVPTFTNGLTADLLDPATGTWSSASGIANGRTAHTATDLGGGRILVVGGQGALANVSKPDKAALSSAQIFDASTNTWSATGSLNLGRYNHTATLLANGKVLVAGGTAPTPAGTLTAINGTAEIWDPGTGLWTTVGSMANARQQHTATLLPSGKVLVAGGVNGPYLTSLELFDPALNTWSAPGSATLAQARALHTAQLVTPTGYPNGLVVFLGGKYGGTSVTNVTEGFDVAAQAMVSLAPLGTGRGSHTSTLLASGKILVAGGQYLNGAFLSNSNSGELYDPAAGGSTVPCGTSQVLARALHTATRLPDGRVLLAGGEGTGGTEIYDPSLNSFLATGPLNLPRSSGHSAASLGAYGVLVTGGSGADGSSEIFKP